MMRALWQDIRYSLRVLVKQPAASITAIGVLTLGIGVNAGIFGLINGLLIRTLPGREAGGEVIGLFSKDRTATRGYRAFSYPDYQDLRGVGGPFASLAAHNVAMVGLEEGGSTRQAFADIVSANFFDTLGVRPVRGRAFTADEERPGTSQRSVVVSHTFWRRTGFAEDILSRQLRVNGQDYGIVGVAPQGFGGTTALIGAEFWLPLGLHDELEFDFESGGQRHLTDRANRSLILIGRLKEGVSQEQADQQLKSIAAAREQAFPVDNKNQDLLARPLSRLSISTAPQSD
jgi:hypothetical protein